MQQLLVEEVTEFLGRAKHQRRGVDMQGYRNGYGKPRRLTMRTGTVTVRRPRVRDLDERLESRLLRAPEHRWSPGRPAKSDSASRRTLLGPSAGLFHGSRAPASGLRRC